MTRSVASGGRGWGLRAALGTAAALLVANGIAIAVLLGRLEEARALVQRTDRVILAAELLLSDVKDAETGQRGFLLTGSERYLEPYRAALGSIEARLDEIEALAVADEARAFLPRLEALVREKLDELAQTVELKRGAGTEAALEVVRTDRGKTAMDELRDWTGDLVAVERRLLARRVRAAELGVRAVSAAALLSAALAAACAGLGYRAVAARDRAGKDRAEADRDATLADLRASERLFRATFEQAAVGIALVAPDGRFMRVNRRLCEILGRPAQDLVALRYHDVTHPDDLDADAARAEELARGERDAYAIEKRYLRPDGGEAWGHLTVAMVRDAAGAPDHYVSVIEDIGARKAAEAEIRRLNAELERRVEERTAALVEANRDLEAFAHTVTHDLRAPLRAVEGFSQALREDLADGLVEDALAHAARIEAAAARMDALIADVLAYSEVGRRGPRAAVPVDLDRVLWNAVADLGRAIAAARAEVEVERPLGWVLGDPTLVRQAAENLLSNAVKFSAPGRPPRVRVRAERRGPALRLWIEDNGIGIEPRHGARVFEPFERLHGREAYEGTGVGLAIVRRAVERMGGGVGLESEPGAGSRFWIELPAAGREAGGRAEA
jgi:PAS domain S-box-containing protein